MRQSLLLSFGAVSLLLLIACTNVANLLIGRASGRQREMALRTALGAGRLRLVRQLVVESLILAGLGAAAGAVIATAGLELLVTSRALDIAQIDAVAIDGRVFAFLFAVAAGAGPGLRCGARTVCDQRVACRDTPRGGDARSLAAVRWRDADSSLLRLRLQSFCSSAQGYCCVACSRSSKLIRASGPTAF